MKKLLASLFGSSSHPSTGALVFHASKACSECGSPLARANDAAVEVSWACPNQDCPALVRERIAHWCSSEAMDIAGVDAALVAKLVGNGLTYDVWELYRLKLKEIAALEGMSPEAAQRLFDGITASLKRDAWRVLFGLGIPTIGAEEAAALGRGFPSVDAVFAAGAPRLMQEAGVNVAGAENIVRWYGDRVNRRLVKRLEKAGLNFNSELYHARE